MLEPIKSPVLQITIPISTKRIQVYAKRTNVESERDISNVWLSGIDASQVLQEFTARERLESVELSDIYDYISEIESEDV